MMYNEFNSRTSKTVSMSEYTRIIEPVYNNIEGMSKDLAAKIYDELGLGVFKALLPYSKQLEQARRDIIEAQNDLLIAKQQYLDLQ